MRRRIFWTSLGVAAVALVLGLLIAVALLTRLVRQAAIDELEVQAERVASAVAREFSAVDIDPRSVTDDRLQFLEEVVLVAREVAGSDYAEIVVVTPAGRLVPFPGSRLSGALDLETDRLLHGETLIFEQTIAGQEGLAVASPFVRDGTPGALVVLVARERPLIAAGPLVLNLVIALTAAALLAAVAARWLAGAVGRRLSNLAGAAAAVAAGDLSVRVPVTGDDEVTRVAEAFNEMAVRLQDTQEREREFLMSVGHDLRTPLTTIAGYAEGLAEGSIPADDLDRVAGVLKGETGRLRRLIDDLMLLARLEAREFTLEVEDVDLAAHLGETVEAFRARADAARVNLVADISPTGPVHTDPDRAAQILSNLIENALRYTPEAGTVAARLGRTGQRVALEVQDSGPGIDPSDLPRVFERFYVARHYRRIRPEGSGLGLAIVKELTDALGGTVRVESGLGRGTTVRVELPAGRPAPTMPAHDD